jgi:hypothetical protein
MTYFDSKQELDNLFKIIENSPNQSPSAIVSLYKKLEKKLNEIYQRGFDDGIKIDKDLYNIINPKE